MRTGYVLGFRLSVHASGTFYIPPDVITIYVTIEERFCNKFLRLPFKTEKFLITNVRNMLEQVFSFSKKENNFRHR